MSQDYLASQLLGARVVHDDGHVVVDDTPSPSLMDASGADESATEAPLPSVTDRLDPVTVNVAWAVSPDV